MNVNPELPVPLYHQLKEILRKRIGCGEFPVGTTIPTEVQLCEEYGLSRITVVRAINDLVREGILSRRRSLGTFVLQATPTNAAGSPRTIAFVTPEIDEEWIFDIFTGFEAAASDAGYFAIAVATGDSPKIIATRLRGLVEQRVRGIALRYGQKDPQSTDVLRGLKKIGLPLVFVSAPHSVISTDVVVADNTHAGYLATKHLLGLGHRRIAFITWDVPAVTIEQRLAGYRTALADFAVAPVVLPVLRVPMPFRESLQRDVVFSFLEQHQVSAAVCFNDQLAVEIERLLLAEGIAIPDDFALMGITDERIAARAQVPLSTVRISARQLGAEAARLLIGRDEGDHSAPHRIVVPVELVIRRSCGGVEATTGETDGHRRDDMIAY